MPIPPTRTIRSYLPGPPPPTPGVRFLRQILDCGHEVLVVDRPGLPAVGESRRCFTCVGMGGLGLREGMTDGR
jgi:hypothetical protein